MQKFALCILAAVFLFVPPSIALLSISNNCASPVQQDGKQDQPKGPEIGKGDTKLKEVKSKKPATIAQVLQAMHETQETEYLRSQTNKPQYDWWRTFLCDLKVTDFLLATFTYWLTLVTAGLIYTGFRQETWSRRLWKTAAVANGLFIDSSKRELRAYVGVTDIEVIRTVDEKIIGRVSFKNSGQTPAHDLTSWICEGVFIKKNPSESSFNKGDDEGKGGVLVPGVTWTRNIPIRLHNLNMDNLEKESDAIWIWGGIDYRDSFGEFCSISFRFWVGEKRWRLDPLGKAMEWWPLIPHKEGNKATYGDKTPS